MVWAGICIVVVGLAAYWLLITTEGTFLGPRVVALLYDWTAKRYDAIKDLHFVDEAVHLGAPLAQSLRHVRHPLILDVATGTGRLPLALSAQGIGDADGRVVGLDRSRGMLRQARGALLDCDGRVDLVCGDAATLAFGDSAFDCVTCLEALEFMANPDIVVKELFRVLRPGGVLLISNRVGWEAGLFPGRISGRGRLEGCLCDVGYGGVGMRRWQVHYDLVWAYKPLPTASASQEAVNPPSMTAGRDRGTERASYQ